MSELERVSAAAGVELFDYQVTAAHASTGTEGRERLCLYYRTGAGKTLTALLALSSWGWNGAVVIAPPATHAAWERLAARLSMGVTCISHAKFRQKGFKLSRNEPVIADEFHLFGGHSGKGWAKFERMSAALDAPVIIASATPNYNDADRVYCIQRVLDPYSCKGGFIQFLYNNCVVEHDPFSATPKVTGFINYKDAETYLASLPGVSYVPDELVWSIKDVTYPVKMPDAYEAYGYNERKHRIVASLMEDRHTRTYQGLVDEDGLIHDHVFEKVLELIEESPTPVLVYANHATVATALCFSMDKTDPFIPHALVTGGTSAKEKKRKIQEFNAGERHVLIGTATLATGTDGLDKVCDRLIILDDTDDDSLRRQLVGRIMPRGADSDATKKQVFRLLPDPL